MPFLENAWYCAAFSHELGEVSLTRRLLNRPVLLTRDAGGVARAIGNMCPHRFAPISQGRRDGDVFECPYHGLRFDLTGACVHNPHGSGKIPQGATLPVYPVAEREDLVFFWPGDPTLADPADIPDLHLINRGAFPIVSGYLKMAVDYRLVLDNLNDLTHAAYIHPGTLSPVEGNNRREFTHDATDRSVCVRTLRRDVDTPSSQAIYFEGTRGDIHGDMEWIAPGTFRHGGVMTVPGGRPEDGAITRNAHLVTPETKTSTHYFWIHTRNRRVGDTAIDDAVRRFAANAFLTEDEPMMAYCQENMDGRDFFALRPLYLESDFAGAKCRRLMQQLIKAEASETELKAEAI